MDKGATKGKILTKDVLLVAKGITRLRNCILVSKKRLDRSFFAVEKLKESRGVRVTRSKITRVRYKNCKIFYLFRASILSRFFWNFSIASRLSRFYLRFCTRLTNSVMYNYSIVKSFSKKGQVKRYFKFWFKMRKFEYKFLRIFLARRNWYVCVLPKSFCYLFSASAIFKSFVSKFVFRFSYDKIFKLGFNGAVSYNVIFTRSVLQSYLAAAVRASRGEPGIAFSTVGDFVGSYLSMFRGKKLELSVSNSNFFFGSKRLLNFVFRGSYISIGGSGVVGFFSAGAVFPNNYMFNSFNLKFAKGYWQFGKRVYQIFLILFSAGCM